MMMTRMHRVAVAIARTMTLILRVTLILRMGMMIHGRCKLHDDAVHLAERLIQNPCSPTCSNGIDQPVVMHWRAQHRIQQQRDNRRRHRANFQRGTSRISAGLRGNKQILFGTLERTEERHVFNQQVREARRERTHTFVGNRVGKEHKEAPDGKEGHVVEAGCAEEQVEFQAFGHVAELGIGEAVDDLDDPCVLEQQRGAGDELRRADACVVRGVLWRVVRRVVVVVVLWMLHRESGHPTRKGICGVVSEERNGIEFGMGG
jgi:hypothetical protein